MRKWVNLLINTVSPGLHYLAYRICYLVYYAPGTGRSIAQWRPQEHYNAAAMVPGITFGPALGSLSKSKKHSPDPLQRSARCWRLLGSTLLNNKRSLKKLVPLLAWGRHMCESQRLGAAAASSPCSSSGCSSPMNSQTRNPRTKSSTLGRTGGKGRKILGPWRYRELRCRTGRRSFFLILEAMSHLMASPLSVRRSTTWG